MICSFGMAQSFHAKLTDEQGRPLAKVTVSTVDGSGNIVAFTITDKDGRFNLTAASKEIKSICFSIVGFEKKEINKDKWKNDDTIILKDKSYTLKEVSVRPDKVGQRGDTLTYSVASFKQGQDRSIADVIKKMPGLEISPNGQIFFEGRAINKFYIEGLDLMGNKYAQASENLSASNVKRVEVYQKHQPVKSLRGVQFSDQAALNLVLKDNVKNVWTGLADIGVGARLQDSHEVPFSGKLITMIFNKKQQNLSMAKTDKTGKNITNETAEQISTMQESDDFKGILSNLGIVTPDLDDNRTRFNISYLATTNHLIHSGSGNDFRIQAEYLWNRLECENYNEISYNDIGGTVISENNTIKAYDSNVKGELTYKVNKEKSYINNRFKGQMSFDRSYGLTMLNNKNSITQRSKPYRSSISDNFEMIKSIGGITLKLSSLNTYNYLPGQLLTIDSLTEKLDIKSFTTNNRVTFMFRLGKFYVGNDIGFMLKTQKLSADYKRELSSEYYRQQELYIAPSINFERGSVRLKARFEASLCHKDNGTEDNFWLKIQPEINIIYAVTAMTDLSVGYSYRERKNDITYIFHTPIFTSYRSQLSHSKDLINSGSHSVSMGLSYKQPIKGLFANLQLNLNRLTNEMLYKSVLDGSKYLRIPTGHYYDTKTYGIQGRLARSLFWAKTFVSVTSIYSRSDLYMLRNNMKTPWRMEHGRVMLSLSMQPAKVFSYEIYSSMDISNKKDISEKGAFNEKQTSFNHTVQAYLFLGKHTEIGVKGDIYHSPDNRVSTNFFTDSHISYKFKRGELSLLMNNIFGNRKYEHRTFTSTTTQYSIYRLRPSEILCKCSIDLF